MSDVTITDAAVEAAYHKLRRIDPIIGTGDIRLIVAAAAPHIAAQALKDMGEWFDRAAQLGTGERDVIAAQACYDRADQIEEVHG